MSDLYELLDLRRDASPEEIKRAYRRKAREHHPDAGGDEETFKQVTHAYEVLSDPQRRARYDRWGDDGTARARTGGDRFGTGFGGIDDVIDAFFGSAFATGASRRPPPGRDVLVGVDLTLEEVVTGTRRDVDVEVAIACTTCDGSGSAGGVGPVRCTTCSGSGQVQRIVRTAFGQVATASVCPGCRGTGRAPGDACADCRGEGRRVERRLIAVDVPPGVEHGDRLRIAGAGEAGRHGAAAGDLYVEVRVAEHELFEREGRELYVDVTVPVTRAALGGTLTIRTVDGVEVEVPVPAGTQPGDVLTVRKAGLPAKGGGRRGDLNLVVDVEVPTALDAEQRELLRRLAELRGEQAGGTPGKGRASRLRDAFQR